MRLVISGKAYDAGLDPNCTDAPKEHGWPEPTVRRAGKGWQHVYDVSTTTAKQMRDHLACLSQGFAFSDVPEALTDGRAMAQAAVRIQQALDKER